MRCGRWTPGGGKPRKPPQQRRGTRAPPASVGKGALETVLGSAVQEGNWRGPRGKEDPSIRRGRSPEAPHCVPPYYWQLSSETHCRGTQEVHHSQRTHRVPHTSPTPASPDVGAHVHHPITPLQPSHPSMYPHTDYTTPPHNSRDSPTCRNKMHTHHITTESQSQPQRAMYVKHTLRRLHHRHIHHTLHRRWT